MRYLVTGGAGFIASHIVDALIAQGHEVRVIDNFFSGKKENINPKAEFHNADIRNFNAIRPHFEGIDGVFHAAAQARIQPSIVDPKTCFDVNVNGTLNVLLAAKDAGVKRLVYSASSSAYGLKNPMPLQEEMMPDPLNPYAASKYFGEVMCKTFAGLYGLETVSLRYFNVYGARQLAEGAYATVVGIFLLQKKNGETLTIVPGGHQRRDFTNVKDVVAANLLAMGSSKVGKGEVINIGTGKNHSVLEVAALIGGEMEFIEPRLAEAKETLADISRAKELLGWEPKVQFEDGVRELMA